jgi:acetyl esterase/lipase
MGSSYFYLEFLLAFLSLLKSHPDSTFSNPAILALEYDLVPDASYPVQLHQALAGYKYVLNITHDPSKIIVSGDSAGGTLILSLLLYLGSSTSPGLLSEKKGQKIHKRNGDITLKPSMALLISPWVTLMSPLDKNTSSDYLDVSNLHRYARQYSGTKTSIHEPLLSPGTCKDAQWWIDASPTNGFFISFGAEEVFAPEIERLINLLQEIGVRAEWQEEKGGVHAWPVASLFLCEGRGKRTRGLETMVKQICERMVEGGGTNI